MPVDSELERLRAENDSLKELLRSQGFEVVKLQRERLMEEEFFKDVGRHPGPGDLSWWRAARGIR